MADEHDDDILVVGEDGEIHEIGELDDTEKAKITPSRIIGKRKPRKQKLKPFDRRLLNLLGFAILSAIILAFGLSFLVSQLLSPPDLSQCVEIHAWWEEVSPTVGEFLDKTELAVYVTRNELPNYILDLQQLKRDFEAFGYPACAGRIYHSLQTGLRYVVFELEKFVAGTQNDPGRYDYAYNFSQAVEALNALGVAYVEIDERLLNPGWLGVEFARAGRE